MNKICLIRPPRVGRESSYSIGVTIPPVGLAYLASSLEKHNFDVYPIDAVGENIDQYYQIPRLGDEHFHGLKLEEIIERIPADVMLIGVSCMFSCEWFLGEELIKMIKSKFPHVPIIIGGEHVTAEAENILKVCNEVDICARGEGELTIVEVAQKIESGESLSTVTGIVYRNELGMITKNPPRERIIHIDELPNPNWEKFPVESYHRKGYGMATVKRVAMPIIASRGCPYKCTFCSSPQMWGTSLHMREPANVIKEIVFYKKRYNIDHIDFLDIVGFMNRAWVKELLTRLIEENLEVTWILGAGTRSEILDDEILTLFKKSNVLRVFYAPESGSKTTIKKIQKRVNLDKMMASMKMANRMGISMRAPVIYGFPEQTVSEAFENLLFSFKLAFIGVDDVVAHVFGAYPGSELYNRLTKAGDINIDELIKNNRYNEFLKGEVTTRVKNLRSWSESIPDWSLVFFQTGGMSISYIISFLTHPKKIIRLIRRVFIEKRPLTLIEVIVYNTFVRRSRV